MSEETPVVPSEEVVSSPEVAEEITPEEVANDVAPEATETPAESE